jgi:hypothetical protein
MSRPKRSMNVYVFAALSTAIATACSQGEQGITQAQPDDPVIVLSEGACPINCPVYDMTLHADGSYVLNAERFVKAEGVSEGKLGKDAWDAAEAALEKADFWKVKPVQTPDTLSTCHPDAPDARITWRTAEGKEKTVTYNAGCGVREMQQLVTSLREAMAFGDLVWTEDRFDPSGNR